MNSVFYITIRIIIIISFYFTLSCNSNEQSNIFQGTVTNEQFKVFDPIDGYSNRCKALGIDNLKTNKAESQIRIWIEFSLSDSGKIIILKNNNNKWAAKLCHYRFNVDEKNKTVLVSRNIVTGIPTSESNYFINKIEKIGIYNLNDDDKQNNSGLCNDGGTIWVETVRDNKYMSYVFPCWTSIKDQTQIDNIKNIIYIVEKEFGLNIFPLDFNNKNQSEKHIIRAREFNIDSLP